MKKKNVVVYSPLPGAGQNRPLPLLVLENDLLDSGPCLGEVEKVFCGKAFYTQA